MDLSAKLGKKKNVASVLPKGNPLAIGTSALGRFVFMDFCQPAKVYLVIALFTLIYYVYHDQEYKPTFNTEVERIYNFEVSFLK